MPCFSQLDHVVVHQLLRFQDFGLPLGQLLLLPIYFFVLGCKRCLVPYRNFVQLHLLPQITDVALRNLKELLDLLGYEFLHLAQSLGARYRLLNSDQVFLLPRILFCDLLELDASNVCLDAQLVDDFLLLLDILILVFYVLVELLDLVDVLLILLLQEHLVINFLFHIFDQILVLHFGGDLLFLALHKIVIQTLDIFNDFLHGLLEFFRASDLAELLRASEEQTSVWKLQTGYEISY